MDKFWLLLANHPAEATAVIICIVAALLVFIFVGPEQAGQYVQQALEILGYGGQ